MPPGARRLRDRFSGDPAWIAGLVLACLAIVAAGRGLQPGLDFCRWDNFEYFSPILQYAHGLWLKGEVPLWNPHQHLGEPVLAQGQSGALYFGYTLAEALRVLLGLAPGTLMLLVVLLHLPLAVVGLWLLQRELGVGRLFAAVAALSVAFGGYLSSIASAWILVLPIFAWLPWILWGCSRQLARGGAAGVVPAVAGLGAVAAVGHPQFVIYVWLTAGVFSLAAGLAARQARRLPRIALLMALGGLVSLPALLPALDGYQHSARTDVFTLAQFLGRPAAPRMLWGLLSPVFPLDNGFLPDRASVMGYVGAWMVPALAAGGAALTRGAKASETRRVLLRSFAVCLGVGASLVWLATGEHGRLYPLTYGIPIWSSLRWPFKILLVAWAPLTVAGGIGLQLLADAATSRAARAVPVALAVGLSTCAAVALGTLPRFSCADVVVLAAAACVLVSLVALDTRWGQVLLGVASVVSCAAVLALSHDMGFTTYPERLGAYGADRLGVDPAHRVLPLSSVDAKAPRLQALALAESATANGYESATGKAEGLVPVWYQSSLPTDVPGAPVRPFLTLFLSSGLMRSYSIGSLLVSANDVEVRKMVEAAGHPLLRDFDGVAVYQVERPMGRAWFAPTRVVSAAAGPYWGDPQRPEVVTVQGSVESSEVQPVGVVRRVDSRPSEVVVEVEAPEGGYLVLSTSFYPGWNAEADGTPLAIELVNGRLMGVRLPPGARTVRWSFTSPALEFGSSMALVGVLGMAGWVLLVWHRARAARAP
ncbi:MAG: hypothetical protein QM765_03935 [Myxococcales bacterium]